MEIYDRKWGFCNSTGVIRRIGFNTDFHAHDMIKLSEPSYCQKKAIIL